ncbi:hypothetical protein BU23DRAFT_595128 [Bimuria novae-zelandiae CBS 107.79]|uniref:Uncharacterized protein n=1 Tax=Bimuria novae-zelandiae CBS 107.79 TaxID=1447943 RepID=A0A6A5VRG2_9PLEO|nr:hypothetical protein BU23DRAFT_595128 [Bimuria novae-zelandiae CBS 107.79]
MNSKSSTVSSVMKLTDQSALFSHLLCLSSALLAVNQRINPQDTSEVPDKGKGLIAIKNIARDTRILSERPIITTPEGQRDDAWLKKHISHQVAALSEQQRESFLSMHNIHPYQDDAEQFLGII